MKPCLLIVLVAMLSPYAWGGSDPMRPLFFNSGQPSSKKVAKVKPLVLSMILNASHRKVAVINGRSVQVGDVVAGYRVVTINENQVAVTRRGKTRKLYLGKPRARTRTTIIKRIIDAEN